MTVKEIAAKEYLSRLGEATNQIKVLVDKIVALETMLQKVTLPPDAMRVKTGGNPLDIEEKLDRMSELKEKYTAEIAELHDVYDEVEQTIRAVENPMYRQLLEYRYICDLRWEEIAVKMGIGWRWTRRMHIRALREIKIGPVKPLNNNL